MYFIFFVILAKFLHGSTPTTLFLSKFEIKAPSLLPISNNIFGLNLLISAERFKRVPHCSRHRRSVWISSVKHFCDGILLEIEIFLKLYQNIF